MQIWHEPMSFLPPSNDSGLNEGDTKKIETRFLLQEIYSLAFKASKTAFNSFLGVPKQEFYVV